MDTDRDKSRDRAGGGPDPDPDHAGPAPRPLQLLVLGGTSWLGGAIARHALRRGHRVTCLARGASGEVPSGATLVRADRDHPDAYAELGRHSWDAVLDVARQPLHVRGALTALAEHAAHWCFVSTLSVYADDTTPDTDETAPVHAPWQGEGLAPAEEYGPAKVACEEAVLAARPDALIARAGLIVGHGDRSDRFGYWPMRFARAAGREQVLVPALSSPVQVIDVEDLAGWLVRCAENRTAGVVNADGDTMRLGAVLDACANAAGTGPALVEVSDQWLVDHAVEPWMGPESLPLWLPQEEYAGFARRGNAAAKRLGLTLRPMAETTRAALAWEREQGFDRDRRAGLSPAREQALLSEAVGAAAPG